MDYWTNLRIKMIHFGKKNRRKIIIVALVIWVIIIIRNYMLVNQPLEIPEPSTTFKPHTVVMDAESQISNNNHNSSMSEEKQVPEKYQKPIENLIDTYFNYCNNGQYEDAYNLLTEDCKNVNYPTIEQFKGYIDEVFNHKKKIYNIQAYSIVKNKYIYNVRILDDILATGTTDGYSYYEEKFVLTEENGEMKLSIAEYIGNEDVNAKVEDDYMIIEVLDKSIDYETETYNVKITNKTDNYIVISDGKQKNEILLDLDGETRTPKNMIISSFFIPPNTEITKDIQFTKFFDDNTEASKITFGAIRILKSYNWQQGTTQEDLDSAIKLYGLQVSLQ